MQDSKCVYTLSLSLLSFFNIRHLYVHRIKSHAFFFFFFKVFDDSGFKRTLCGGTWESLPHHQSSTARVGCCPIGSFMSNPFVAFSEADSCTACPSNALTTTANDDITCSNNVCPTGMVYLDTFYGCVKKLPNGDGANSTTGNAGTLRRAVSDWIAAIAAGGASTSTVVVTYGPIEDWDVSEVTNMQYVFYNFGSFNADLSKWNTGAVTTMLGSKCTLPLYYSLCDHAFRCSAFLQRQLEFHLIDD